MRRWIRRWSAIPGDIRTMLRDEKLRYTRFPAGDVVVISFKEAGGSGAGAGEIEDEFRNLLLESVDGTMRFQVEARMSNNEKQTTRKFALDQNITYAAQSDKRAWRVRTDHPAAGDRRIVVQLPGAQDPARLKDLLGATAT